MQTLSIEKPKAKKQHKCDFCGLIIEIGEVYELQKNVSEGTLYSWKYHLSCNEIASKLDMFDNCDEGVTGEDFKENIRTEYQDIMISKYNEIYESKDFSFPIFAEQLSFVKTHHGC
jgi:basic membrane lipoprotein Med (substrate-binding protein (PBP1-ABC) superfamily)